MRKVLGTRDQYYIQSDNAQVELFKDYFGDGKMIACPTCAAMGFDISGRPMDVFTPGEQPEDSILMIAYNPANLAKIKERGDFNDNTILNEIPQVYDVVGELLYGTGGACRFVEELSFEIIKKNIKDGIPMMAGCEFPHGPHYILIVGFDDDKNTIIYNDPNPENWPDKEGYNREMDMEFFNEKIVKSRVDFYPVKEKIKKMTICEKIKKLFFWK